MQVSPNGHGSMCKPCQAVHDSKVFKNALQVKMPEVHNFIYVNHLYWHQSLGELFAKTKGLYKFFEVQV